MSRKFTPVEVSDIEAVKKLVTISSLEMFQLFLLIFFIYCKTCPCKKPHSTSFLRGLMRKIDFLFSEDIVWKLFLLGSEHPVKW